MSERNAQRALPPAGRETRDVSLRFIAMLLGGIAVALLLLIGLAWELFPAELHDSRFATPFPAYPAPMLQTNPAFDMERFHAAELQRLNSAGWQDKAAGTLHIPIDQAMRAIAAEGIPAWPVGDKTASKGDRR